MHSHSTMFWDTCYMGPSSIVLLSMLALLAVLESFFNRILFELETLNGRMGIYTGHKMNKQTVSQGHTSKPDFNQSGLHSHLPLATGVEVGNKGEMPPSGRRINVLGISGSLVLHMMDSLYPFSRRKLNILEFSSDSPPPTCLLRHWKNLDPESLRKKIPVFYCNQA